MIPAWLMACYLAGIFFAVWAVWPIGRESGAKPWAMFAAGIVWPAILIFAVVAGTVGAVVAAMRRGDE